MPTSYCVAFSGLSERLTAPLFAMTWLRSGGAKPLLQLPNSIIPFVKVLESDTRGSNTLANDFLASVVVSNSAPAFSMLRVANTSLFRLPPTVAAHWPGKLKVHSVKIELFTAKFCVADGRSAYGGAGIMNTPLLVRLDCWTIAPRAPVTPTELQL